MLGYSHYGLLGRMIGIDGISLHPSKMKVISDWSPPSTGKDMQRFLGMGTYLRDNVPHYAEITAPLFAVENDKEVVWTDELRTAWEATKQAIRTAPILRFPDLSRRFVLACDASLYAISCITFQPMKDDEYITAHNMVGITSHKLTECHVRWPPY